MVVPGTVDVCTVVSGEFVVTNVVASVCVVVSDGKDVVGGMVVCASVVGAMVVSPGAFVDVPEIVVVSSFPLVVASVVVGSVCVDIGSVVVSGFSVVAIVVPADVLSIVLGEDAQGGCVVAPVLVQFRDGLIFSA